MPLSDTLQLLDFSPKHVPEALRLSQQVGWPHRREDWALTLSQSTGVVVCNDDRVVGTALVSLFGDVATLSMIIVDEALRGQRLGRTLMAAIIARAEDRELRLVATQDGLPLYRKLGFETAGEIAQLQGIARAVPPDRPVHEGAADLGPLVALDRAATGMDRTDLLRRITAEGTVLAAETGFAVLRDFGRGKLLGPIVAEDLGTAKALVAAASQTHAGGFLRLDTPDPELGAFAETLGLAHVGGGTRMRRNAKAQARTTPVQTFGLVSQALG